MNEFFLIKENEDLGILFCFLFFTLNFVHVRGKRGRPVPILFNKVEEEATELLIRTRDAVKVDSSNICVFAAATRGSKKPLRGNDYMAKVLKHVPELKSPERIASTELRKYYATVSQVVDLTDNDLRWLADHMGHNIEVHKEFYCLQESTVKLTKVLRLLLEMAMDVGNTLALAGKKLSEISVDGKFS